MYSGRSGTCVPGADECTVAAVAPVPEIEAGPVLAVEAGRPLQQALIHVRYPE